jgi:hypothetical protein
LSYPIHVRQSFRLGPIELKQLGSSQRQRGTTTTYKTGAKGPGSTDGEGQNHS